MCLCAGKDQSPRIPVEDRNHNYSKREVVRFLGVLSTLHKGLGSEILDRERERERVFGKLRLSVKEGN